MGETVLDFIKRMIESYESGCIGYIEMINKIEYEIIKTKEVCNGTVDGEAKSGVESCI